MSKIYSNLKELLDTEKQDSKDLLLEVSSYIENAAYVLGGDSPVGYMGNTRGGCQCSSQCSSGSNCSSSLIPYKISKGLESKL